MKTSGCVLSRQGHPALTFWGMFAFVNRGYESRLAAGVPRRVCSVRARTWGLLCDSALKGVMQPLSAISYFKGGTYEEETTQGGDAYD